MENKNVDLDPNNLDQVITLSAGNSIYVTMPLLCDPSDCPKENEIKRIVGNVGKPGISLLVPPISPKIRRVEENEWNLVNHFAFDGKFDNSFQHTTLHLSFTRYRLPINTTSHGNQDTEAHFVETLISVFDRDEWVADLDVLNALKSSNLMKVKDTTKSCYHREPQKVPRFTLASIDSWHEFLDKPKDAAIIRVNKNWHARLAAAVLCVQQKCNTILFQDENPTHAWKTLNLNITSCQLEGILDLR
ncbi:MAG: hypothetical protein Q9167_007183, partial [Letrouitia subvulpina]